MTGYLLSHVTHYRNLSNNKFIVGTTLFEDELLSSWLIRCAYNHLTAPTSFTNMHFSEYSKNVIWQRDLDVWAPDSFLYRLSFKSGIDILRLKKATIRSFEGVLFEHISGKSWSPFISALGNYCHVKKLGGLKFCPLCWSEDEHPYLRKNWRLSFYTVCVKHNVFMSNKCYNCSSPLTISKTKLGLDFTYCFKCGTDLKKNVNQQINEQSYGLIAINKLLEIIDDNVFEFDGDEICAVDFFRGLRQLKKLIYLWGYHERILDHEIFSQKMYIPDERQPSFYESYMSLQELYLLYSASMKILSAKENVVQFIKENKIRPYALIKDSRDIFWLD